MSNVIQIISAAGVVDTLTGNTGGAVGPTGANINIIGIDGITVDGDPLTSTLTISGGGGGGDTVVEGDNINIDFAGSVATINLNKSIIQPATTADGTQGVYALGATDPITDRFMHNYGTECTFLGYQAGNMTHTSDSSVAIGTSSAYQLTSGSFNTFVGFGSGFDVESGGSNTGIGASALNSVVSTGDNTAVGNNALSDTIGSNNSAFGSLAAQNLVEGSNNLILGVESGSALLGSESSCVLLASAGVTGESNTIRIGTEGFGPHQQNNAYMAGIYARVVDPDTQQTVVIDSMGKLGSIIGGGGSITEVDGGDNINVNTVAGVATVNLNKSIAQPVTNGSGSEGMYSLGGDRFMHAYGGGNTFLGGLAGNLSLTSIFTTALGRGAAVNLTNGNFNTCVGATSLQSATTATQNSALGAGSGANLVDGSFNLLLSYQAGINLAGGESSCVLIANAGVLGESNTIRVGSQGSGDNEQNNTYIAGIWENTVDVDTQELVIVDSDGKLGSISSTTFAAEFDTDSGNAVPSAGILNINGDANISTSGSGNTVAIALSNGTDGQLLIGGGSNAAWANITSTDSSVTITNGTNSIDLSTEGGVTPVAGCRAWVGSAVAGANAPIYYECSVSQKATGAGVVTIPIGPTFASDALVNFNIQQVIVKSTGTTCVASTASGVTAPGSPFRPRIYTQQSSSSNDAALAPTPFIGADDTQIIGGAVQPAGTWIYNVNAIISITTV